MNRSPPAAAPSTPAPISVASVPISSAIGPVSANETGISPAETNQSRLDTRPSISDGTRVCMSAFHTTIPTVFRAKPTKENTNSCQGAPAIANPAVEQRAERPADVHHGHVAARGAEAAHEQRRRDPAQAARRHDRSERGGTAAEVVADQVRQQHLERAVAHEQEERRAGERRPQPWARADEREALAQLLPGRRAHAPDARLRRHEAHRDGRRRERERVHHEGRPHVEPRDQEAPERRAREAQPHGLHQLLERARLEDVLLRHHVRHDRRERRGEERVAHAVQRRPARPRATAPSTPASASAARPPTATTRRTSATIMSSLRS